MAALKVDDTYIEEVITQNAINEEDSSQVVTSKDEALQQLVKDLANKEKVMKKAAKAAEQDIEKVEAIMKKDETIIKKAEEKEAKEKRRQEKQVEKMLKERMAQIEEQEREKLEA